MLRNSACDKKYKITLKEGHCVKVKGLSQYQISEIIKRFFFSGCENNLHLHMKSSIELRDEDRRAFYVWTYKGLVMCDLPALVCADAAELTYDEIMEESKTTPENKTLKIDSANPDDIFSAENVADDIASAFGGLKNPWQPKVDEPEYQNPAAIHLRRIAEEIEAGVVKVKKSEYVTTHQGHEAHTTITVEIVESAGGGRD